MNREEEAGPPRDRASSALNDSIWSDHVGVGLGLGVCTGFGPLMIQGPGWSTPSWVGMMNDENNTTQEETLFVSVKHSGNVSEGVEEEKQEDDNSVNLGFHLASTKFGLFRFGWNDDGCGKVKTLMNLKGLRSVLALLVWA